MTDRIKIAQTDEEILGCFPVISELRPHISRDEFVPTVKRLSEISGFQLAFLSENSEIKAVAGIRVSEWLHRGKYLEVEDLATKSSDRSKGYGRELFDWVVVYARQNGCAQLRLVSGVKRVDAHRFYHRKGMTFEAHYFSLNF